MKTRWGPNNDKANATYETITTRTQKNYNRWTARSSQEKTSWVLKLVLPVLKITLISDATPNWKHMFGPHRELLPHHLPHHCNTHNHIYFRKTKLMVGWLSRLKNCEPGPLTPPPPPTPYNKMCHIPKCSPFSVVSETAGINWRKWWRTEKSNIAANMAAKY